MTALLDIPAPALPGETITLPPDGMRRDNYREYLQDRAERLAAVMVAEGGQRNPVLVAWDSAAGEWLLVDGDHRRGACAVNGWDVICRVTDDVPGSADVLAAAMSANLTAQASTPVEDAIGFGRLAAAGWDVDRIAARMGSRPSVVRQRLSILDVCEQVRYLANVFGPTYVEPLIGLPETAQRDLAAMLEREDWNRAQWCQAIGDYRAQLDAIALEESALFGGDFGLSVEEWSTERGAYLSDLGAPVEETPPAPVMVRERVLGLADIADHIGAKVGTVHKWQARGQLPAPELSVSGMHAWYLSTVDAWHAARQS